MLSLVVRKALEGTIDVDEPILLLVIVAKEEGCGKRGEGGSECSLREDELPMLLTKLETAWPILPAGLAMVVPVERNRSDKIQRLVE